MADADALEEARAQLAATSEILRIISRSPTGLQPVFESILRNATHLCGAHLGTVGLFDGEKYEYVAQCGGSDEFVQQLFRGPFVPEEGTNLRRILLDQQVLHVPDRLAQTRKGGAGRPFFNTGARTMLEVPMVKEGKTVGAIVIYRPEVRLFTEQQVELVKTFANQAVIAIENVRLLKELETRNADLGESLEQQTATAEILRVISSSPTDIQPVLDAVAESAARLCAAEDCEIHLFEGNVHKPVAHYGTIPLEKARAFAGKGPVGPAMRTRRSVNVLDMLEEYPESQLAQHGVRSALVVPLLRELDVIGAILLRRLVVEAFNDKQIKLLETFATQAVIAIENVRLFNETKDALEQQRATAEILRVRTEQLAEANRAKSSFLAAASHDLRQPVHALGLFVAQLGEARDPAARERIIEKVEASTAAVSQLVEALLDISKLDQGTVEPQISDLALQPLLDRLEQAFSMTAQAKDLRFRLRPSPLWVRCDSMLLERIVFNLVANAVRYTQEGGIVVAVRRRGSHARIEVRDTGIGIAAEDQQHIFEEFYQAAGAPDDASKGLGLGLAIVDRLVRLLGLAIRLRSAPGQGSLFAIDVPLTTQQAVRVVPISERPDAGSIEGLRVLLIDDDAGAREAAEGLLTQWGCEVVSASSGSEAYAVLSGAKPPAVIISDYRLGPRERGTDVVREIRKRLDAEIPAVIVSADSSVASHEAIAADGLHLLRKPLKAAQLRVLLHHMIVSANRRSETTAPH